MEMQRITLAVSVCFHALCQSCFTLPDFQPFYKGLVSLTFSLYKESIYLSLLVRCSPPQRSAPTAESCPSVTISWPVCSQCIAFRLMRTFVESAFDFEAPVI